MIGGGEWFPPHPPRGDGLGSKVSFSAATTGTTHPVGAASPRQERDRGRRLTVQRERLGGYLASQGSVLVWEVGRSWGHVDQERLPFSAWCRRRPFRHRQEVHQLVTQLDAGADQRRAVGGIETRSDSLGVDRVQLTLAAEHHATR